MIVITPQRQAEILAIADDLEKLSLKHTANRVRAILGELPDDERPCPIQDREAGLSGVKSIPWGLAEILYPAYGHDQSLERLAERGGFGRSELGMLAADCYAGPGHPRLKRMPLLTLYEMAKRP